MKSLTPALRAIPFIILFGAGGFAVWTGMQPPALPPAPEIPPDLLAAAYVPKPPAPPPPVPPEGGSMAGHLEAPEEVWVGQPFQITLSVTNTGTVPLHKIVLWSRLPEETHTRQLSTLVRFTKDALAPGESYRQSALLISKKPGLLELTARIRSAEGVETQAKARIQRPTAVLIIEPAKASPPGSRCFAVTNVGTAAAHDVLIRITPSDEPTYFWPKLAGGEKRTVCFDEPTSSRNAFQWIEASATAADPVRLPFPAPPEEQAYMRSHM